MQNKTPTSSPLYAQVMAYILEQIKNGRYGVQSVLPSEWDLSDTLQVSQGTVRKAFDQLVHQGVLYRRQGVGTFVAEAPSDWGVMSICPFGLTSSSSMLPKQEILSVSKDFASDSMAEFLQLRRAQSVWKVMMLWRLDAQIIAIDEAYLSGELLDQLSVREIAKKNGIYDYLQKKHAIGVRIVEEQILSTQLSKEEAMLLRKKEHDSALLILRMSTDLQKQPLEWRKRVMVAEQFALVMPHIKA